FPGYPSIRKWQPAIRPCPAEILPGILPRTYKEHSILLVCPSRLIVRPRCRIVIQDPGPTRQEVHNLFPPPCLLWFLCVQGHTGWKHNSFLKPLLPDPLGLWQLAWRCKWITYIQFVSLLRE